MARTLVEHKMLAALFAAAELLDSKCYLSKYHTKAPLTHRKISALQARIRKLVKSIADAKVDGFRSTRGGLESFEFWKAGFLFPVDVEEVQFYFIGATNCAVFFFTSSRLDTMIERFYADLAKLSDMLEIELVMES